MIPEEQSSIQEIIMSITPQMVKDLRDKTGAGMADCKKALDESQGNMEEAIEILRKRGAASAAKRADRSANEGIIIAKTSADGSKSVIVEVNCETDFVARNEEFVKYAEEIANALLSNDVKDEESLMAVNIGGKTLLDLHNEILAKFSEKIGVKRFEVIKAQGFVADYIHAGSRLGVLVETNIQNAVEDAKALLRDIAMQIAAMNPGYVKREDVQTGALEKEIEIYRDKAIQEGKNPEIADRIAKGQIEKFYQEQCLLEQSFVKDSKKTVNDILSEIAKLTGEQASVLSFRRYFLGE
ncbi:MAG: elongation factor Ts [Bacteroidetes bacterium]|nr:elongation factor Ts [Bacteroidota bacterium]